MKTLLIIVLAFFSFSTFAQKNTDPKEPTLKTDSVKIPKIMEDNMKVREQRLIEIRKEYEILVKQNDDDYTAILQFAGLTKEQVIGNQYKPGYLILKIKPKP